jgi:predicted RND superfamily exporter protein
MIYFYLLIIAALLGIILLLLKKSRKVDFEAEVEKLFPEVVEQYEQTIASNQKIKSGSEEETIERTRLIVEYQEELEDMQKIKVLMQNLKTSETVMYEGLIKNWYVLLQSKYELEKGYEHGRHSEKLFNKYKTFLQGFRSEMRL